MIYETGSRIFQKAPQTILLHRSKKYEVKKAFLDPSRKHESDSLIFFENGRASEAE